MPQEQRNITFFAVLSFLAIFVLTGCIDSGDPLGIGPDAAAINPSQIADECPSWGEACGEIGWAVWCACPPDGDWKNDGQWKSCRKKAAKEHLKDVKGCFSVEELDELRECVLSWTPDINDTDEIPGGDSKIKIRTE